MSVYKPSNNYYNKQLRPLAGQLRKNLTKSEACLWKYVLKARQMKGYQFRRQRPVLNYIVDFMCPDLKLIIEIDGITHDNHDSQVKDKIKTNDLEKAGFKVLRFQDKDILNNIEGVKIIIERIISDIEYQRVD